MPVLPPSSICKRDGVVVPFEPDKLSRSLFAASESMGAPDAFLARELTDCIIHFLASETVVGTPTTSAVADLTAKVVRELGYPALAQVYAENIRRAHEERRPSPLNVEKASARVAFRPEDPFTVLERAAQIEMTNRSLDEVYPRDLVSAHRDGLLTLMDLDFPGELLGMVLSSQQPPSLDGWELLETLVQFRGVAGSFVALDCPEHAIVAREGIPEEMASQFLAILDRSLWLSHLHGVLNLNIAEPPAWGAPLNMGPLFQEFQREMESERLDRIALFLLRRARKQTVYWHLTERDLREAARHRLKEVVNQTLEREQIEFCFDRPRHPVILGPGIDRQTTAVLGMVGMNLPRFVEQLGGSVEPAIFLKKLASLARFAKSAGHARQDYLRKAGRGPLHEGFLLERAVQVVVPMGLLEAVEKISSRDHDAVADLACRSLATIREALETDRPRTMAVTIDSPVALQNLRREYENLSINLDYASANLPPRQQLRYGSDFHAAAGSGLMTLRMKRSDANELPELLRAAWKSAVARLKLAWHD